MDCYLYGINTITIFFYSKRFELSKTINISILLWWCDKSFSYAWLVISIKIYMVIYNALVFLIHANLIYIFL